MVDFPKVSACIVTYNSPIQDVTAAAESFNKAALNTQLIIIDNASKPKYREALQQALRQEVINTNHNGGFGYGHNQGFQHSDNAEYHLVLNPDVVIHEGALETMVEYMDAHPEIGMMGPKVLYPDGEIQHLNKRYPTFFTLFARRFLPEFAIKMPWVKRKLAEYVMLDTDYDAIQYPEYMSGCFMLFRADLFRRLGGFDERFFMYFEDTDITIRVNEVSKAMYYPGAVITHKWARGSYNSWYLMQETIKSALQFFQKWGWRLY
jgi:GT2 family glycosyltransferase